MFASLRPMLARFACAALLFTAAGCGCEPTRHPVYVSLSPLFKEKPAVEVVITALNASESAFLADYPMSRFFVPGDTERGGLEPKQFKMNFTNEGPGEMSFTPADKEKWEKLWTTWEAEKANTLFVLAYLPGHFDDKKGNLDARRIAVPLGSCRWEKKDEPIKFVLTPAKLELTTPPKPAK